MTVTAILIAVLMLGTSVASATTIVFNLIPYNNNNGTMSYDGALHGTSIGIKEIVVNGTITTPAPAGMVLNFDTGTLSGGPFAFTFTGGTLGIVNGSNSYMYGTFTVGTVTQFTNYTSVSGQFNDFKFEDLEELLNLLGIAGEWTGHTTVSFYGSLSTPGRIISGDVTNESAVPEPSLILLLGLGLAAVVLLQWKISK